MRKDSSQQEIIYIKMSLSGILQTVLDNVLGSCHLICYSTLLGSQLYQTFIVTKIGFIALPRPAFVRLQKQLFPVYFRSQSLLLLATAITFPTGPLGLVSQPWFVVPLAVAGGTALLNLLKYGPKTRQIMLDRSEHSEIYLRHAIIYLQLTCLGGQEGNNPPGYGTASHKADDLNKAFRSAHAMSIHLNLITVGASLIYGLVLSSTLQMS